MTTPFPHLELTNHGKFEIATRCLCTSPPFTTYHDSLAQILLTINSLYEAADVLPDTFIVWPCPLDLDHKVQFETISQSQHRGIAYILLEYVQTLC